MPTRKYVFGSEVREHAERIARVWTMDERALFGISVRGVTWNDDGLCWFVMVEVGGGQVDMLQSDFVVGTTGLLNSPKIPRGFQEEVFKGRTFHAARGDYEYTGGTPGDEELVNLVDMRVGVLGTRATAVHAVPHLAKWAKQLVNFQWTPSAAGRRDNHPTNPDW